MKNHLAVRLLKIKKTNFKRISQVIRTLKLRFVNLYWIFCHQKTHIGRLHNIS